MNDRRRTGERPSKPRSLDTELLYRSCDSSRLGFSTTSELTDPPEPLGQSRAVEAVDFGIRISHDGYNLFALGAPTTDKHALIRSCLERHASALPAPADWCYVHNFDETYQPRAIRLAPGQGPALRSDMSRLVERAHKAIIAVLENDEFRIRHAALEAELENRQERALSELGEEMAKRGVALIRTGMGVALAPLKDGTMIDSDTMKSLPEEEQNRFRSAMTESEAELEKLLSQLPTWRRQARERLDDLKRTFVGSAVGSVVSEVRQSYPSAPEIQAYLSSVERDLIDNVDAFRRARDEGSGVQPLGVPTTESVGPSWLHRYQINTLVVRCAPGHAPVVYEDNPTYANLMGRIEHIAQMGALVTDFTLIKPGALHRANGGYLILDAFRVLSEPFAWEGLKRALRTHEIRIGPVSHITNLWTAVTLEPDPIPLDVKVILIGTRSLHDLLHLYDPDFRELFKVGVDFEESVDRSHENDLLYARLVAMIARRERLRHLDVSGVARVIEHSARISGDAQKLSIDTRTLSDLLRESDYWAGREGRSLVQGADVQRAIDAQVHRDDRVREIVREHIKRRTLLITCDGTAIGEVNGLSVVQIGGFSFGRPIRITARVRMGRGSVIDIEREVELGGPIHSKGVLILSGFLAGRYIPEEPLSLSASLVFEQSYGPVEGDSASSAELYAMLSALSGVPIRQSLAVTGSVNQLGQVQAISDVNEKIEGFFDTCAACGLTGEQGVLVPAANVQHLMLRREVVDAAREKRFHIYAVETIDEGIELLTGVSAGERDAGGRFPEGSINRRVEQRLIGFAAQARSSPR